MKIAVIGSGISGLSAAYLLSQKFETDLYEKENRFGGHSRTIQYPSQSGPVPVDTGFLVFNTKTYPLLTKLFERLGTETIDSNMSFSVYSKKENFVYNGNGAAGVFFQKKNLLSPAHWRMVYDILKFNKNATEDTAANRIPADMSLREYLKDYGDSFRNFYLYPMGASIWSTPSRDMEDFPARSFLRFFFNHGLLTVSQQPVWKTVKGGSVQYVEKILKEIKGVTVTGAQIRSVKRINGKAVIGFADGSTAAYDHAVFAVHAPDALALLEDADTQEKEYLSSFQYKENLVLSHGNTMHMYKDKKVWSSWNYFMNQVRDESQPVLTYWINLLQRPPAEEDIFVTLNDPVLDATGTAKERVVLSHPVFDKKAMEAQSRSEYFDNRNSVSFCGAWQRYGFHEDGLWSAVRAAEKFGCRL